MNETLEFSELERFENAFDADRANIVAMHATVANGILDSSKTVDAATRNRYSFSIDLETGDITNQKKSGRCWMFAALNVMRLEIMVPGVSPLLGQTGEIELLPGKHPRDPGRTVGRKGRETSAPRPDRRRRPVGHVREFGTEIRSGAQGVHAREQVFFGNQGHGHLDYEKAA
jgi:hypothetical protein